ncbi:MAG: hypothetical protein AAF560_33170 [Acidobacteriota bacterium]
MASLSILEIDDEVYEGLRRRAKQHGVSLEEEVRRILRNAVATPDRLGKLALDCFGPVHGIELDLSPRELHEPPYLDP